MSFYNLVIRVLRVIIKTETRGGKKNKVAIRLYYFQKIRKKYFQKFRDFYSKSENFKLLEVTSNGCLTEADNI